MKSEIIIGCLGIVILAVIGIWDPEKYLFPKCPFHQITGWLCPGCGSQRAIHHLIHGHVMSSFKLNPLLIPGLTYAVTGYTIASVFPGTWVGIRENWYGRTAAYIAFAVIVVFWIVRNIWD